MAAPRLAYLDTARGLAVLFSLLAHALLVTGAFEEMGDNAIWVKQFTRMATPLFLVLFGFMIEHVYVRQVQFGQNSYSHTFRRCLIRSAQCYTAFAIISAASVVGGYRSMEQFVASCAFLTNARFGNIFRVYSVLLLLVPCFVWLRVRFGALILIAMFILVATSCELTTQTKHWNFGVLGMPINILFGAGERLGGPSIWHSSMFLCTGMLLGLIQSQTSCVTTNSTWFKLSLVSIVVLTCSGILLVSFQVQSLASLWVDFASGRSRSNNRLEYYLIGIVTSTVMMLLMSCAYSSKKNHCCIVMLDWLASLGQRAFLAYTLGNVILNVFGPAIVWLPAETAVIAFLTTVWLFARFHIDQALLQQFFRIVNPSDYRQSASVPT